MWSRSNSIVTAYVAIITTLTCLVVSGVGAHLFEPMGFWPEHAGLTAVAVIMILAGWSYLFGAELPAIAITGSIATLVCLTYDQEPLIRYLTLSALLFSIGVYGMTVSRNAVRVLMSIELMLNAVNINMVAFARYVDTKNIYGQLFAIFILTVAAAEAAVGLAIVLAIYRNSSTVDMEKFSLLKW